MDYMYVCVIRFTYTRLPSLVSVEEMRKILQEYKLNADDVEQLIKEVDKVCGIVIDFLFALFTDFIFRFLSSQEPRWQAGFHRVQGVYAQVCCTHKIACFCNRKIAQNIAFPIPLLGEELPTQFAFSRQINHSTKLNIG